MGRRTYVLYEINRNVVRNYLKENSITFAEASSMLGKNRNYIGNLLRGSHGPVSEKVVDQLCSLGISKAALLNMANTIETSTGKVIEKPVDNDLELKEKLFGKKIERDPEVERISRAVDENGEHLPFSKRMELLRGGTLTATLDKAMDTALGFEPIHTGQINDDQEKRPFTSQKYMQAYKVLVQEIVERFAKNPAKADISLLEKIQQIERDIINA